MKRSIQNPKSKIQNRHGSIVIASRNHAQLLHRTLASIRAQRVPFRYELIVVDDGSTDDTGQVCRRYGVDYCRLENDRYRNPSVARNFGYRRARGEVVIAQSDDVVHRSPRAVERLVLELAASGEFLIATVHDRDPGRSGTHPEPRQYTGPENRRPLFFLGSLWRRDLYAIGGNDEDFAEPGYEDNWFADCLMHGLGLEPRYLPDVIAWHQPHPRPYDLGKVIEPSRLLYQQKCDAARRGAILYRASGGPWRVSCVSFPGFESVSFPGSESVSFPGSESVSFPGSAWERIIPEAPPRLRVPESTMDRKQAEPANQFVPRQSQGTREAPSPKP
ncbi:MAG: glycosyltransferase family 2 protein [Pirellulales bacterium]|nr:glycosyltransferase family 2 protein [Pirellulales bacterium]